MQGGELIWGHSGSILARLHGFGIDLLTYMQLRSQVLPSGTHCAAVPIGAKERAWELMKASLDKGGFGCFIQNVVRRLASKV